MLKGAIESVSTGHVEGWIATEGASLRGRMILAFIDGLCVGTGYVDKFRRDIAAAGLGDGYSGFVIETHVADPDDVARVIVRLENSDAAILQNGARIVGPELKHTTAAVPRPLSRLHWMRAQRWLEQSEFDYLKSLDQFGVYDRVVPEVRRGGSEANAAAMMALAKYLLELNYMDELEIQEAHIQSISDLKSSIGVLPHRVVGIWSSEPGRIAVAEGSHLAAALGERPPSGEDSLVGAIEYRFGGDYLLILNVDGHFAPATAAPASGITIYSVAP